MSRDRLWIVVLVSGFLGLMVDGMDLMFLSYSLPSLMEDLRMSRVQAGSLASYSLLGMALGGVFGGWAADRFGRVRVVVWTIMLFSIATAALGLTQTYWQFAIVRFISALGLGAEYVVCNTLMAEYVPTERRTTVLGTLQAGWSAGYVVATVTGRRHRARVRLAPAVRDGLGAGPSRSVHPQNNSRAPRLEEGGERSPRQTDESVAGGLHQSAAAPNLRPVDADVMLPAIRLLRRQQLAADVCRQRARVRLHENDELSGGHLRGDDSRQDRRRLPGGYRRPALDVRIRWLRYRCVSASDRPAQHAWEHRRAAHDLRVPLRRALRRQCHVHDGELRHASQGHCRGWRLQPRTSRSRGGADADRSHCYGLLHRSWLDGDGRGLLPDGHHSGPVHPGEDVPIHTDRVDRLWRERRSESAEK